MGLRHIDAEVRRAYVRLCSVALGRWSTELTPRTDTAYEDWPAECTSSETWLQKSPRVIELMLLQMPNSDDTLQPAHRVRTITFLVRVVLTINLLAIA